MRLKPFALWIHHLSAPDQLHFLNLFGLLPFTRPRSTGIGISAPAAGDHHVAAVQLNPAMDPAQQRFSR